MAGAYSFALKIDVYNVGKVEMFHKAIPAQNCFKRNSVIHYSGKIYST